MADNKKRLFAAVLAGFSVAFGSAAMGVPAAFAESSEEPSAVSQEASSDDLEDHRTTVPPIHDDGEGAAPTGDPVTSSDEASDDDEIGRPTPDHNPETGKTEPNDSPEVSETDSTDEEPEKEMDPDDSADPLVEVEQNVRPGESLTITGSGFSAGGDVKLVATADESRDALAKQTVTASAAEGDQTKGTLSVTYRISEDAAPGSYTLTATDLKSGEATVVSFRVLEKVRDDKGDSAEERPQISLDSAEVYPGEALAVEVARLTPDGKITFQWNPTVTRTADGEGRISTELVIPEDTGPGDYMLTVTDVTTGAESSAAFTVQDVVEVHEADATAEPALSVTPEIIPLQEFVGEPEDGAGVTHVVENLQPGTEISYTVSGPDGVNDYESAEPVNENGRAGFVIHGVETTNLDVYLGDYTTVVTYQDEAGQRVEFSGTFTVVTGDAAEPSPSDESTAVAAPAGGASANIDGTSSLAQTGANGVQLALLAGALLVVGGAILTFTS